jgi:hypothetical protein
LKKRLVQIDSDILINLHGLSSSRGPEPDRVCSRSCYSGASTGATALSFDQRRRELFSKKENFASLRLGVELDGVISG